MKFDVRRLRDDLEASTFAKVRVARDRETRQEERRSNRSKSSNGYANRDRDWISVRTDLWHRSGSRGREREKTLDSQRRVRRDRRADSTVVYRLTEKRVAGPRDDRRTARLEGRRRSRGWPDEGESENEVARRERESELVGEREEEGRKALARAVCWSLEEAATRERERE